MATIPPKPQETAQILAGLAQAAYLRNLPPEVLDSLAPHCALVSLQTGQALFAHGKPASVFFAIVGGECVLHSPGGVLLRPILPGELAGAVGLVLKGAVYPARATAITPSLAIGVPVRALQDTAAGNSIASLVEAMAGYLIQAHRATADQDDLEIEIKVSRVLLYAAATQGKGIGSQDELEVRIPQAEIARMAGTNLFTVSRLLKRWVAQHHILIGRSRILIRDPRGLLTLAEGLGGVRRHR